MSDLAIKVQDISKRYRIGKLVKKTNGMNRAAKTLSAPFEYLISSFQKPGEDEILWALKDVTFEVNQGEVVGILGKNGAGKSTLLKILSRITDPSSGTAQIKGRVGSLLEVGTGFHPELTGRENIFLNGAILGMRKSEIARKFDEIVAFAEVSRFIDTQVKRYSSGMYVRLAFAVAAHLETEILLVDEVLAVGDAAFQKKCLGKMGDVAKEGRTILFVSHNMVAIQNLCKRSIWLQDGQISAEGPTSELVSSYLSNAFSSITEQSWPDVGSAPGNDKVRIRRICIRPETGSKDDLISLETPLVVEVDYWNLVPDACLHLKLHFINEQQIIAFTSGTDESDPLGSERCLAPGLYRSICKVPKNLLNEGAHSLLLRVVKNMRQTIYRHDDILTFNVIDTSQRNGTWYGKELGAVRPKLDWHTTQVGKLPTL
jgi:lipopolysaccharide transport system ATP-binding protein